MIPGCFPIHGLDLLYILLNNSNIMKKYILITSAVLIATLVNAQDIPQSQVPSVILNAFQQKFSDVSDLEWEIKGDLYKAEFEVGNRDHDVWINKEGIITKHKEDFPKGQLPDAIRSVLESQFPNYRIDDVDKIETEGRVFYQVELDGKSGDRVILFNADGSIESNTPD